MDLSLFYAKIDERGPDECWEWQGSRAHNGYGLWGVTNRPAGRRDTYIASRLAYELATREPIPEGLHVLHSCDNPPCCNVAHLWLGTALENAHDKMAKGRLRVGDPAGENNGHAKLTWEQVDEIRARPDARGVDLAVKYGISQQVICNIRKGRTWKRRPAA